jgi:glycosyltransferase involved in cell wall biosynthesis
MAPIDSSLNATATGLMGLRARTRTSESRRREVRPPDLVREEWRAVFRQMLGDETCRRLGLVHYPPSLTLSVVVPVYNERATIREILHRIQRVPIRKEIIAVDDFSTDGTREILHDIECEASRADGNMDTLNSVRVVYHNRNRGKGAALRTGFANVTGSIVIVQDADLEYNPDEYPTLIEPIFDGRADVVFGSRFIGETHRVLYFWHYVGNKLLTMTSNMLTGLNLTDMETCYKVFRREVIEQLAPTLKSNRFGFEPEITAKIGRRSFRVYEVPVSYSGRSYDEGKKIGWKDGVQALWCMVRYAAAD